MKLAQVAGGAADGELWHIAQQVGESTLDVFSRTLKKVDHNQIVERGNAVAKQLQNLKKVVGKFTCLLTGNWCTDIVEKDIEAAGKFLSRTRITKLECRCGNILIRGVNKEKHLVSATQDFTSTTQNKDWKEHMWSELKVL